MTTIPMIAMTMSEEQQAAFYAQLGAYEKDEVAGVLLALFLGTFGAHHFYLRRTGLGVLYVLFSWSGLPTMAGFIECFFMPSRVQRYNLEQAAGLAASIRGVSPQSIMQPMLMQQAGAQPVPLRPCSVCGAGVAQGVRFCAKCGSAVV